MMGRAQESGRAAKGRKQSLPGASRSTPGRQRVDLSPGDTFQTARGANVSAMCAADGVGTCGGSHWKLAQPWPQGCPF